MPSRENRSIGLVDSPWPKVTLEVCYENALYKFTFDIDIDI